MTGMDLCTRCGVRPSGWQPPPDEDPTSPGCSRTQAVPEQDGMLEGHADADDRSSSPGHMTERWLLAAEDQRLT